MVELSFLLREDVLSWWAGYVRSNYLERNRLLGLVVWKH